MILSGYKILQACREHIALVQCYFWKIKLLILFSKNSVVLVLYVLYMPANICISKASFRPSKVASTKTYTLSFALKKVTLRKNEV